MFSQFEPHRDFQATAAEVLGFLHDRLGFSLWMVTRAEGNDWIVLQAEDHGYGISQGDVYRWSDSLCSQMTQNRGPHIAPRVTDVPAYADAPLAGQLAIGAYIGLPLVRPDGTLFGTLCAIDPEPQPDELFDQQPLLEFVTRLLSTILAGDLRTEVEARRAEFAEERAETDSLTGVFNRRGWDRFLQTEEARCRRYGHTASIFSIDLDHLKQVNDSFGHNTGDAMLIAAAEALSGSTRECDVVARVGGDEFAVLAVHCDQTTADDISDRLDESLSKANVRASIGVASRDSTETLKDAWAQADRNMYRCKKRRQGDRRGAQSSARGGPAQRKTGDSASAV
jgi:diguanylate cyclase (GGDEF)-like protein